jgi:hypothetical protein
MLSDRSLYQLNCAYYVNLFIGCTSDWTDGVRFPTEAEDFSSNLCVHTGSGVHPASYTMGPGG